MKIIDAHVHPTYDPADVAIARKIGVKLSLKGLREELERNDVVGAIGLLDAPNELKLIPNIKKRVPQIFPVYGVDPDKASTTDFEKLRRAIKKHDICGIKIYLGYFPVYATSKKYTRFYKIAKEFDIPVIFHTGDTYGEDYHVKYAKPLQIDDVAVQFRDTNFLIAHAGSPWFRDTAEVVYKNHNVFTDLSALYIGKSDAHYNKRLKEDVSFLLDYVDNYDKFLYGTDWPLVKMNDYISFMKKIIPRKQHSKFFYKNAKKVFKLNSKV